MYSSLAITLLVLAILFGLIAESGIEKVFGWGAVWAFAGASVFCCYGLAVWGAFVILKATFMMLMMENLSSWLAISIAIPLAAPLLYLVGKSSEG